MPNWKHWSSFLAYGHGFPSLQELRIRKCQNLTGSLQSSLPSLKLLHIYRYLANKVENLQFQDCSHLKCTQLSKDLCQELKFLQDLDISDCDDLEFFSGRWMQTPNLASLSLSNCKNLGSMPEQMHTLHTSLQAFCLSYCPKLESFPNGGWPPNLYLLLIENCDHLTPQKDCGLNKMTLLTRMTIIVGCSDLKLFPEEGLLPASLISVQVVNYQSLKC
ncbi:hypothetical protein LWI29_001959 [Acer saccharum]|uniref:Uncharacterized protein n=1 Tax=Acer saccharum TaxID=4024 RepID=A0AA39RGP1_ACESA|nr:hypothetical protein LWI29_001959 [Acer saccharum]